MKKPCNDALSSMLQLKLMISSIPKKNDKSLFAYTEMVNNLLTAYSMDDMIAETVFNMHSSTKRSNVTASVYSDALWREVLRCGLAYDEA